MLLNTHMMSILACNIKLSDDYRQKHGKVCGTGDSQKSLLLGVVVLPPVADARLNTQLSLEKGNCQREGECAIGITTSLDCLRKQEWVVALLPVLGFA